MLSSIVFIIAIDVWSDSSSARVLIDFPPNEVEELPADELDVLPADELNVLPADELDVLAAVEDVPAEKGIDILPTSEFLLFSPFFGDGGECLWSRGLEIRSGEPYTWNYKNIRLF